MTDPGRLIQDCSMLPLPIAPAIALAQIIVPALSKLPAKMDSPSARVQLLATALQESNLKTRRQYGDGPARGLYQFEQGGVHGVRTNKQSSPYLLTYCYDQHIDSSSDASIWSQLEYNDELATVVARLLLWVDSHPLPALGNADDAWAYYIRNWRPGKPRAETWHDNYRVALDTCK